VEVQIMSRAVFSPGIPFLVLTLFFVSPLAAQEAEPGWEIFAPTENTREGEELTLDPEDDPGVQKPEFSLDELSNPTSLDPDVFIRYSAGKGESSGEPRVEPPPEKAQQETVRELPAPPKESPVEISTEETVSTITAEQLTDLKAPIPVVETLAEYRRALANREPEIIFEGKRWVYSEERNRYVDPQAAALAEARRVQEALRANEIAPATGIYPLATYPGSLGVPETVDPRALPLEEGIYGGETDQYRVPGVTAGREDREGSEGRTSKRKRLRTYPVYGGSR
jgi:hypothetical protein